MLKKDSDEVPSVDHFEPDFTLEPGLRPRGSLAGDRRLEYIPDVADYLSGEKMTHLTPSEGTIFRRITQDSPARDDVLNLLTKPMDGFLSMQVKLLEASKRFRWITDESFPQRMHSLVFGDLSKSISTDRLDSVCSLKSHFVHSLEMSEVPGARWVEPNFISMLGCISSSGSFNGTEIQKKILKKTKKEKFSLLIIIIYY